MRPDVQDGVGRDHARRGDGRHADAGERRVATHVEAVEWCGMAHELSRGGRQERSIGAGVSPIKSAMGQWRRGQRDLYPLTDVGHVALDGPPQNLDRLVFRFPVGRRLVAALREELLPVLKGLRRLRFVER